MQGARASDPSRRAFHGMAGTHEPRFELRDAPTQALVLPLEHVGATPSRGQVGGEQRQDRTQACEAIDEVGGSVRVSGLLMRS
jgi:hypothetical protein